MLWAASAAGQAATGVWNLLNRMLYPVENFSSAHTGVLKRLKELLVGHVLMCFLPPSRRTGSEDCGPGPAAPE